MTASRRRARPRRRRTNRGLVAAQIGMLSLLLLIVLFFRSHIGDAASAFVSALGGGEDIRVEKPGPVGEAKD